MAGGARPQRSGWNIGKSPVRCAPHEEHTEDVTALVPVLGVLMLVVATGARAQETAAAGDPAANTYGVRSANASRELEAFAFLIGKWEGVGKTRLPDGKVVEYPITWIGRYILDGTAIADEVHGTAPDGTRAVGITFRQYDRNRKAWVIEFLAEPNSRTLRGSRLVGAEQRQVGISPR